MFIELGYGYQSDESPFIDYFKRLKDIGFNRNQIKEKLPMILSYYEDMVKESDTDWFIFKNKKEKLQHLYEKFANSEFYGDWNK
jgi:hypothetical protein